MPSVRQMASTLSVNPNTIQKAYTILEERGVIYSVKGKGSFVSDAENTQNAIFEKNKEILMKAVSDAYSTGFSKNELLEIVNEIYGKGES